MSDNVEVTSLGETTHIQGPYRAWHLKVVDGSADESTVEVRIYNRAETTLRDKLGRPLTPQEMERVAACWGKEKVRDALSMHLPMPPTIRLTSREVAGIEAQLLLKRYRLM